MNRTRITLKGDINDADYSYTFIEDPTQEQVEIAKILKRYIDLSYNRLHIDLGDLYYGDEHKKYVKPMISELKSTVSYFKECKRDQEVLDCLFDLDFCVTCEEHARVLCEVEIITYEKIL